MRDTQPPKKETLSCMRARLHERRGVVLAVELQQLAAQLLRARLALIRAAALWLARQQRGRRAGPKLFEKAAVAAETPPQLALGGVAAKRGGGGERRLGKRRLGFLQALERDQQLHAVRAHLAPRVRDQVLAMLGVDGHDLRGGRWRMREEEGGGRECRERSARGVRQRREWRARGGRVEGGSGGREEGEGGREEDERRPRQLSDGTAAKHLRVPPRLPTPPLAPRGRRRRRRGWARGRTWRSGRAPPRDNRARRRIGSSWPRWTCRRCCRRKRGTKTARRIRNLEIIHSF